MTESNTTTDNEIPPPRENEINQIPELSEGDTISVETLYDSDPNRTLTVSDAIPDAESVCGIEPRTLGLTGNTERSYILKGYGTKYHLTTVDSLTRSWRRVVLAWQSQRHGIPVTEIEVLEE